ncbi:unnamed protein product, partial [Phaeothamnion confervicola]
VIHHISELQADARLMLAAQFLSRVEALLADPAHRGSSNVKAAAALLSGEQMSADVETLRQRAAECAATLRHWDADDWILSQSVMGVTTSYKKDPNGSLWIKLHGVMDDVPVFDQMATVREVDLYELWVPFCSQAYLLKHIGRVEVLSYLNAALPGLSRDCVLHAYACDCLLEDSCILIQGRSVGAWPGVELPETKGWFADRMDIHAFRARIELLSPTRASTSLQANIDPKAPVPQALIDFLM